jgi:hypothetical protein
LRPGNHSRRTSWAAFEKLRRRSARFELRRRLPELRIPRDAANNSPHFPPFIHESNSDSIGTQADAIVIAFPKNISSANSS